MPEYRLLITEGMDGCTVRHAALYELRLSGGQFKRAKFHGLVTADGQPVRADCRLRAGQTLALEIPEEEGTKPCPYPIDLRVPFEDEHMMMVDKPAPLAAASSSKQEGPSLENAVFAYLGCPSPFVYRPVNRLDKGTSGLMIVAKTAHAQDLLQRELHTADFRREYLAVVEGRPPRPEGWIDLPIAKAEGATVRREVHPLGKAARTYYKVLEEHTRRSLVRLCLDTGRTHQIRVHMSALGCPVAGDFLYGGELPELPGRFALHSALCAVRHPVTGVSILRESPLPYELRCLLR